MPTIKRKQHRRREWNAIHRRHLRYGADAIWVVFGEESMPVRRRYGASDFTPGSMLMAELCWRELRDEMLATVNDPWDIWAYRRFDLNVEPLRLDTGAIACVPPKDWQEQLALMRDRSEAISDFEDSEDE